MWRGVNPYPTAEAVGYGLCEARGDKDSGGGDRVVAWELIVVWQEQIY